MAGSLDVLVKFVGDSSSIQNEVSKVEGTGSKLKGWAKGVGGAVATGFAVGAVVNFGQASVEAAMESEQATARLEQIFKSMGDTTGEAAAAAEEYASALSKQIGVDDDLIKAGQAQLATFGAVSSEAARTAGVFDRATAAGADLAAAGFGTIDSNAVQLGKALQDPTKGLTALGKAGVTFTDEQKTMIEGMQESGDLLGAQNVVLKAVESQVKGTAAATATSSDKMNVAFGETQEAVGTALLPILEKLLPILMELAGFIEQNISWLLPLAAAIGILAIAWNIASLAATLFGVSMLAALGPVLIVIAAIAALIAIGVLIVKNWDTIKDAAAAVWRFMQDAWDKILGAVQGAFNWIKDNWPLLLAILTGPVGIAVLLVSRYWDQIKEAFAAAFNFVKDNWQTILAILTGPIGIAVGLITANFTTIKDAFTSVYDWIKEKVEAIAGIISGVVGGIKTAVGNVVNAIKAPINAVIRAWNAMEFSIPKVSFFGKDFGGQKFELPQIDTLEKGGIVKRTGLAVVHEGEQFSGVGNTFGGHTTFNVNVQVPVGTDPSRVGRTVVDYIRAYERANGTDWRTAS